MQLGPDLRPLDFGALMTSHDSTHQELARTVDDLMQWLSIVETGLNGVLEKTMPASTTPSATSPESEAQTPVPTSASLQESVVEHIMIDRDDDNLSIDAIEDEDGTDGSWQEQHQLSMRRRDQFFDIAETYEGEEESDGTSSDYGRVGRVEREFQPPPFTV